MKHLVIPILASFILTSCLGDIRIESFDKDDADAIASEIKQNIRSELSAISLDDTIYSTVYSTDTIVAGEDTIIQISEGTAQKAYVTVNVPAINVEYSASRRITEAQRDQQRTLLSIVFVAIPCATLAILAVILAIFLYKRMRSRHEVIEKAIDNEYTLPDSFYNGSNTTEDSGATTPDGIKIPPLPSDVKQRDSGFTLVIVGIVLMLLFAQWDATTMLIVSLIPLLIGVGKLLTYYRVIK